MMTVSAEELKRLKKRFMKLDKDGSGSIDKEEFLQIPQIANNPLASRMIAIFDEESVAASSHRRSKGSRLIRVVYDAVEEERSTFKNSSLGLVRSVIAVRGKRNYAVSPSHPPCQSSGWFETIRRGC